MSPDPSVIPEADYARAARRFRRIRSASIVVLAVVVVAAIAVGAATLISQHGQLQQNDARLLSSCNFYKPLTTLPVTPNPHTKPARLGVQIIAGAREAYAGQHCGVLAPPDPSLVRWAAYFHIRLP